MSACLLVGLLIVLGIQDHLAAHAAQPWWDAWPGAMAEGGTVRLRQAHTKGRFGFENG